MVRRVRKDVLFEERHTLLPSPTSKSYFRWRPVPKLGPAGIDERTAPVPSIYSSARWRLTDILSQNVPLEDVQYLAGHSNPSGHTEFYDGRRQHVTRNIVERVSI